MDDAQAVSALVESAYEQWVPVLGRRPRPMDEDYSVCLSELEGWVEHDGDALLGVIVFEPAPDHLWVDNVAVSLGTRGRGLGGKLLELAAGRARDLGLGELRLLTHELMNSNIALYEHLGWSVYEPEDGAQDHFFYFKKPAGA